MSTTSSGARRSLTAALRIGTRGSALAMAQASLVVDALSELDVTAQLDIIETEGDRRAPDTAWGEGAFVGAIEHALLDGAIDVAVHSAKDLPTDEDPRLTVAAYLPRDDPRDVLVLPTGHPPIADLADLPSGSRVGTDSPRRTAFLRATRPDLRIHPIHGNVDTRLRRLDDGETDALVLAAAGLRRLGRSDRISMSLATRVIPPAPGQGALALQVRAIDARVRATIAHLDDVATRRAVQLERRLLALSGGGCRAPLAAVARVEGSRLAIVSGIAAPDGRLAVTTHDVHDPADGWDDERFAAHVLERLAEAAARRAADAGWPTVVVTRPGSVAAATRLALVERGLRPIHAPTIAIQGPNDDAVTDLTDALEHADWLVVTSANAVPAIAAALAGRPEDPERPVLRVAAIGDATARSLRSIGLAVDHQSATSSAAGLFAGLPIGDGAMVVVPCGDRSDRSFVERLEARGARARAVGVYRTIIAPAASVSALVAALDAAPTVVLMASPSAVRGWLDLAHGAGREASAHEIPVVAIGPTTAAETRSLGLHLVASSASTTLADVADTVAEAVNALLESR